MITIQMAQPDAKPPLRVENNSEVLTPSIVMESFDLCVGYRRTSKAQRFALHKGSAPHCLVQVPKLHLVAGELICLLGPNGAGKSTLMRTLGGFHPPLSGCVTVDGKPLNTLSAQARARTIGIVLTDRYNVAGQTVFGLAALGRHPHTGWFGRLSPQDRQVVWRALEMAGVHTLANHRVDQLSDGQRQRAMIARALAQASRILFLDEPTAFLDLPSRIEIMGLLRSLAHTARCAVVVSSHDLDLALRTADRVWLLAQPARLIEGGPEDMALSGALGQVFASENIQFDRLTGAFGFTPSWHGLVRLEIEEPAADRQAGGEVFAVAELETWTRRALERIGLHVLKGDNRRDATPASEEVRVRIGLRDARPCWWVIGADGTFQPHDTLYALAHTLARRPRDAEDGNGINEVFD